MSNFFKPFRTVKERQVKQGYTIFTAVMVLMFAAWVFFDAAKAEVVIAADGDVQTIKTTSKTVGELLEDLGIDVGEYDELSHVESTEIVDGMEIRFETAHKVSLTIDGETEEYHTTAITVGQFFEEEDLTFSRYDDISHSNIAIIHDNFDIEVTKAIPVVINDGGEKEEVWTTEETVEDLLENEDIEYDKNDRIEPALDEDIEEDMQVKVTYVTTKKVDKEENVPFEVEKKNDGSLKKGTQKTVKDGKDGTILRTYEITLENGEEVNREVIDEDVVEPKQNKVIAVGTKAPVQSASTSTKSSTGSPSGKTMTMVATAYSPDCAGCSGYSATGMNLKGGPKVIAVDPGVIPLGSRVWVEGYGEAIAADTGGAIKGNRIDVLYPSKGSAYNWGRRTVQVKVLN